MLNEQDANANHIENEPETTEELSSEELDQVVGGTDPKPKPSSTKEPYLVVTLETVYISSVSGN